MGEQAPTIISSRWLSLRFGFHLFPLFDNRRGLGDLLWLPRPLYGFLVDTLYLQGWHVESVAPSPSDASPPSPTLPLFHRPRQGPNPRLHIPSHFKRSVGSRRQLTRYIRDLILRFRILKLEQARRQFDFRFLRFGSSFRSGCDLGRVHETGI